jgi:Rrf2 family protein
VRVTTRTRYAIRALYDLAFHRHGRGQSTLAKEIASRQQIPLRFLEQILQDLRRGGLVEARRGPHGGYTLAHAPSEISLADVLRAVRGPLEEMLGVEAPDPRRKPGALRPQPGQGSRQEDEPADPQEAAQLEAAQLEAASPVDDVPSRVWADVGARLIDVLEQTTLADFVARAEATGVRRAVLPATMYFI